MTLQKAIPGTGLEPSTGTYFLPFSQGQHVIELGGGDNPAIRPNYDIREGPLVDGVVDFGGSLPMNSESFDGVYCCYALEHISWRKVKGFVGEVHRILKPGGLAVFITANLLEQARILVEKETWAEGDICMIFGDQDYPENSHYNGFSPKYAKDFFSEQGFYSTRVIAHPDTITDMIIEARKSKAKVRVG